MYNLHILKISRPCTEQLYLTLTFFGEREHYQLSLKLYCETVHTDPPSASIFNFWYIKLYFPTYSVLFIYLQPGDEGPWCLMPVPRAPIARLVQISNETKRLPPQ